MTLVFRRRTQIFLLTYLLTWPHLRCDVGLEEGKHWKKNRLCVTVLCIVIL